MRSVNEGFSGGEKKRNEIFQMAVLEPKLAVLDETDSGLDIDALKIVSNGVNKLRRSAFLASTVLLLALFTVARVCGFRLDNVPFMRRPGVDRTTGPDIASGSALHDRSDSPNTAVIGRGACVGASPRSLRRAIARAGLAPSRKIQASMLRRASRGGNGEIAL